MNSDKNQQISPLVEHLIPDAPIEKKIEAQGNIDAFMDVMYRICSRLEAEGYTPEDIANLTKS